MPVNLDPSRCEFQLDSREDRLLLSDKARGTLAGLSDQVFEVFWGDALCFILRSLWEWTRDPHAHFRLELIQLTEIPEQFAGSRKQVRLDWRGIRVTR